MIQYQYTYIYTSNTAVRGPRPLRQKLVYLWENGSQPPSYKKGCSFRTALYQYTTEYKAVPPAQHKYAGPHGTVSFLAHLFELFSLANCCFCAGFRFWWCRRERSHKTAAAAAAVDAVDAIPRCQWPRRLSETKPEGRSRCEGGGG